MSVKSFFTNGLRAVGVLLVAMMANAFSPVADAAVVVIDLASPVDIRGPNAGLAPGDRHNLGDFPMTGVRLQITNARFGSWGLDGDSGLSFAVDDISAYTNPSNLSAGTRIDSTLTFSAGDTRTRFRSNISGVDNFSPAFGPGSFMGMRMREAGLTYYGWVEVTWNGVDTFEILAMAYESTPDTPIEAGSYTSIVPEPSMMVIGSLMGVCGVVARKRKRKQ